jgi:hypothetical protein
LPTETIMVLTREHGVPRKPIQFFVGAGKWDDQAVMGKSRRDAVAAMGEPAGVLVPAPQRVPQEGDSVSQRPYFSFNRAATFRPNA